MKMPIVSLNNMAMNESVAATCCFAAVNVNGHNYETVLSGGYLTDKISGKPVYKTTVNKSWLTIPGDYMAGTAGWTLTQELVNGAWTLGAKDPDGKFYKLADCTPVAEGNYALYQPNLTNCDHNGDYCAYVANVDTIIVKTHVGSTVEHSASKNWAADHAAIRFNS